MSLTLPFFVNRTISSGSGDDALPISPPASCSDTQVDQMLNVMDTAFNHGKL